MVGPGMARAEPGAPFGAGPGTASDTAPDAAPECAEVDARALHLILHPTEQCNFRCTYCYERFGIGRMAPDTISGIKRLLATRHDLERLHVGWFGGEPLVAPDVVRELSRTARTHCALHGIAYSADMTTNGYRLTEPLARELVGLGIGSYQISLDGDCEAHDRTRRRANGAGSFATIWRNLEALMASDLDLEILLRIHYHRDNLASIESLIERLARAFAGEKRLTLFFRGVSPLGGENDHDFPFVERARQQAVERRLAEALAGRLRLRRRAEGGTCYACLPNALVIRADGTISKCTVALYDERNIIGRLHRDGRLEVDDARLRPWLEALVCGDPAARACPLRALASNEVRNEMQDASAHRHGRE